MSNILNFKLGWIPDLPDFRDYTPNVSAIRTMTYKLEKVKQPSLPQSIDLRPWCSPVENQGTIGSCTAHAVAAAVEYFENKAAGKYINASRLFLYKTTRNLMHLKGDTGATLRSSLGALVLFGMPPEEYWPYKEKDFDVEPDSFNYAFGQSYKLISYFRHDPADLATKKVLESIKKYLAASIPSVFGFTVYNEIKQAAETGRIPYPGPKEKIMGGHALIAVGYDDNMEITNQVTGVTTTGALLFQNSWGKEWGENGFGWLPYEYVLRGLACDWWSILKQEWIDTGIFTVPN